MAGFFLSESVRPEVPDEALRHCVMTASQARSRVSAREGGRGARGWAVSRAWPIGAVGEWLSLRERAAYTAGLILSESDQPEDPAVALRHCVAAADPAWSRASASEGRRGLRGNARYVVPCERADLRARVRARGPCWG
jgi:hypothetical protein